MIKKLILFLMIFFLFLSCNMILAAQGDASQPSQQSIDDEIHEKTIPKEPQVEEESNPPPDQQLPFTITHVSFKEYLDRELDSQRQLIMVFISVFSAFNIILIIILGFNLLNILRQAERDLKNVEDIRCKAKEIVEEEIPQKMNEMINEGKKQIDEIVREGEKQLKLHQEKIKVIDELTTKMKPKEELSPVLMKEIERLVSEIVKTPADKQTANDYFLMALEAKDFNEKLKYYKKAIELKPDEAVYYNNRAIAYYNNKEYDLAIKDYNKAIELKTDYADAYNNRATAYDDKKEYDLAIKDYNKAIELKPTVATAYYNRGITYQNMEKYDLAIRDYNKAIELKTDYADAYFNRGTAYYDKKEYDLAIKDYNKAVELKPDDAAAYFNRGIAYYEKKEYDLAIKDYNKAIDLKTDYADAYYNRGLAYYNRKEYDLSNKDYNKAIELKPDDAAAYFNRGLAYYKQKEYDLAIKDYNGAIGLKPDEAKYYYYLSHIFSLQGKKSDALKYLEIAANKGFSDIKLAKTDKALDSIRDDPKFIEILEKIELNDLKQ